MIVIDSAPHSEEIWNWYHENRNLLDVDRELDSSVRVFTYFFADSDVRHEWPREFYRLDAAQFWELFTEIFMVASGISANSIGDSVDTAQLDVEVLKLKRAVLWWAYAEELDPTLFGDFDVLMADMSRGRLNQRFRYRAFYMFKVVERGVKDLKTMLAKMKHAEVRDMKRHTLFSVAQTSVDRYEFILNAIKKSCAGDHDEFLLYTIDRITFLAMNEFHEKLAHLVRFERFDNANFTERLPPGETWRLLFNNYFDGVDDVLTDFYKRFPDHCIMFFLNDYVYTDFNIKKIPWYNVFTSDDGASYTTDIVLQLNPDKIQREINRIHRKYQNS